MPTAHLLTPEGKPRFAEGQISIVYLACLARDIRRRGQGYGDILLIEALRRAHLSAALIGVARVFLYSLEEGVSLYHRHGFEPFSDDPKRLFLPMSTIRQLFEHSVSPPWTLREKP